MESPSGYTKGVVMRKLLVVIGVASFASASPISVGPIYMSGSGTYSWTQSSGPDEVFGASGSNGSDTVSLSINQGVDLPFTSSILPTSLMPLGLCSWDGSVVIDGIFAGLGGAICGGGPLANYATWSLGNGTGSVSIFDSSHNLLATASLIAYVGYTGETQTFDGSILVSEMATLDILPTPEPTSLYLCLAGLGTVAFRMVIVCQTRHPSRGKIKSTQI